MSFLPDERLACRAAAGDLGCFEEILARYRDRVYRLCYRMAGNAEDAEDWAQECFVRVYLQLGRYNPDLPFSPWFLRVISNACLNLAKTRAHRQAHLSQGLTEEIGSWTTAPGPEQTTVLREEVRAVHEAIDALPPLLRQAVTLRILEDLSFRELAETLDVPLQTAATRVRRALIQVREQLLGGGMGVKQ